MNSVVIITVLTIVIWAFFVVRLRQAVRRKRIGSGQALYAWSLFFLLYLVATTDVDSVQRAINSLFGGLPAAQTLRSLLILATAQTYLLGLKRVVQERTPAERIFYVANPAAIVVIAVLFGVFSVSQFGPTESFVYLIRSIRAGVMIIWILSIFLPIQYRLWKHETVRPMKFHHAIQLLFYGAFIGLCAAELFEAYAVFAGSVQLNAISVMADLFKYLCLLLFVGLLLPFSWLISLAHPARILAYWRLRQLEVRVRQHSDSLVPAILTNPNLLNASEVELETYRRVISILDRYSAIDSSAEDLKRRIEDVVSQNATYPKLAQRLAEIRL
ncbi:MAG: hypothetical protein L6Q98_21190 [Anaerolineae bacterium]|nr:hypothetical protein [Anaerolineae bacterium]NUQ06483.1 hypothetical protein [Anaerolineae bacterium]